MKIGDFPFKQSVANSDLILIQDSVDSANKHTTKENLLAGLSSSGSSSTPLVDPIPNMVGLAADWSAENVVISAESLVSQITDVSSNNKHASQGTGSSQATLISNCLNNKPVLRFGGNQFYLHSNLTEPATIIAVIKNTGTGHRTVLGALSSAAGAADAYYFKANDPFNIMLMERSNQTSIATSSAITSDKTFFIQSARLTATSIELFIDSVLVSRLSRSGAAISIDGNGILGGAYYNNSVVDLFVGDIYRICMFSEPLSHEDVFKAINYLKQLLGI